MLVVGKGQGLGYRVLGFRPRYTPLSSTCTTRHLDSNSGRASLPNDGSFFAEYQRLQAEKAEAASLLENTSHAPPPEEASPPLPAEPTLATTPVASVSGACTDSDFLSSPSWSGLKRGYMFKLGDQGLGGCPTSGLDAAQHCHPHWAVRLCVPCRSPSGSLWLAACACIPHATGSAS